MLRKKLETVYLLLYGTEKTEMVKGLGIPVVELIDEKYVLTQEDIRNEAANAAFQHAKK